MVSAQERGGFDAGEATVGSGDDGCDPPTWDARFMSLAYCAVGETKPWMLTLVSPVLEGVLGRDSEACASITTRRICLGRTGYFVLTTSTADRRLSRLYGRAREVAGRLTHFRRASVRRRLSPT